MTAKYDELKRQSLFIRSSPDFYKTDWIADSSTGLSVASNNATYVTLLKNPDSGTSYYITRQADSSSTFVCFRYSFNHQALNSVLVISETVDFKLNVTTSEFGARLIPMVASSITLGGRESKVIVTDYAFGALSKLQYSTAQIFYGGVIGNRDVLFLHGDSSQEYEFAMRFTGTPNKFQADHSPLVQFTTANAKSDGMVWIHLLPGIEQLVTIYDSDTMLVLYADSETAATFWSPAIAGKSDDPFKNFWSIGTNESILVGGPYLVREAKITDTTLALRGDLKTDVRLSVIASKNIRAITWNGESVTGDLTASLSLSAFGGFVAQLQTSSSFGGVRIPKLSGWKFKDSLPEVENTYDDSNWTVANHTSTNIPLKPYYGDGTILYGCDYGL